MQQKHKNDPLDLLNISENLAVTSLTQFNSTAADNVSKPKHMNKCIHYIKMGIIFTKVGLKP